MVVAAIVVKCPALKGVLGKLFLRADGIGVDDDGHSDVANAIGLVGHYVPLYRKSIELEHFCIT